MTTLDKPGNPTPRHEHAVRFLNFLFYGMSRGHVEFSFMNGSRKPKVVRKPAFYSLPLNAAHVAHEVLNQNDEHNVLVGLSPRHRVPESRKPGTDQDVLITTCLWVELDYRRVEGGAVEVVRRIAEFPLRPSIIVDSDYGRQIYYVFNQPASGGRLLLWDKAMRSLCELFAGSCQAGPSCVLPLPGSSYSEDKSCPTTFLLSEADSGWLRYSLEELESASRHHLAQRRLEARRADKGKAQREEAAAAAVAGDTGTRVAAAENGPRNEGAEASGEVPNNALPPTYEMDGDGSIWHRPPASDTERKAPRAVKVSNSYLRIAQIQEDIDTGQISFAIEYDYLGRTKRACINRSQMADLRQLVATLAGGGAPVTSNNARPVLSYLTAYEHAFGPLIPRVKVTGRFGRHRDGGPFYLPGTTADIEFLPGGHGDASIYRAFSSRRGSLQGWTEMLRQIAGEDFFVPQTAVLASLVPPLQSKLQIPNFILDINGNSSTGKSTSLKLAASVYGRPVDPDSMIMQWMNTRLAVEHIAGLCSGLPIFLDDAQHCPNELKRSIIYLIANGRGKGRVARNAGVKEITSWHTVALSTSEEPLHRASPHEGARGRILSIGGSLPPFPSGMSTFVQSLEREAADNHGHPGELYVRHLNGWTASSWAAWQKRYWTIRQEMARNSSSNLVDRVSGYVAAIQIAGEIAGKLFGLPFNPEAVGKWLMLHITEDENVQNFVAVALNAMADHYVKNIHHFAGDGRHTSDKSAAIHGTSKSKEFVGFLSSTVDAIFKRHNLSRFTVLNKMAETGILHATENGRHTKKVGVDGLKHRMVCVKWVALFNTDRDEELEAEII